MAEKLSMVQLMDKIDQVIFENEQELIKALFHNALLKDIVYSMYPVPDEDSGVTYSPTETYNPGPEVYALWVEALWKFIATESKTGVEPGTDPTVWEQVPMASLAHAQHSDFKLGRYTSGISLPAGGGIIDLTGPILSRCNKFTTYHAGGTGTFTIQLMTRNGAKIMNHPFMIMNPATSGYNVKFENGDHQYIGPNDATLTLTPGHFAWFMGSEDAPGGTKTRLMYTSVPSAAATGNPFNQDLNTDDSVAFVDLLVSKFAATGVTGRQRIGVLDPDGTINALAGAYFEAGGVLSLPETIKFAIFAAHVGKILGVAANGALSPLETVTHSDVVFSQIKLVDAVTGETGTWQQVDGVLVKVS